MLAIGIGLRVDITSYTQNDGPPGGGPPPTGSYLELIAGGTFDLILGEALELIEEY